MTQEYRDFCNTNYSPEDIPEPEMPEPSELPWRTLPQVPTGIFAADDEGTKVCATKGGHTFPHVYQEVAEANAALIVTAVNNHAPMLKTLEHCAALFDTLAVKLDRWAAESRSGGWSTHQVDENRKTADDCRRYAGHIRAAIPRSPQERETPHD